MNTATTPTPAQNLSNKVIIAIRLADVVGRSRGINGFAVNEGAVRRLVDMETEILDALAQPALAAPPTRCNLCGYQYGHCIGCENNPVDIALKAQQPTPAAIPDSEAMPYAIQLAKDIYERHYSTEKHYASGEVKWSVDDTLIGVLLQIDNMVTGLKRPAPVQSVEAIPDVREWIEEALSYVGCESWSPSIYRDGVDLLAKIDASVVEVAAPVAPTPENPIAMALALFPVDLPGQSFVVNGDRLTADGDDRFYSAKKVEAFIDAMHEQITKAALSAAQPQVLSDAGRKAYTHMTDNHPTIHSNRFPGWNELDDAERTKWNARANLKLQAGGEA